MAEEQIKEEEQKAEKRVEEGVEIKIEEPKVEVDEKKALTEFLVKKEEELKAEKDKVLRAYAEMENFKKRKEQEKQDFCKYSLGKIIKEILVVLDSFDRAVEHARQDIKKEKKQEILDGFMLIQKQLHSVLEKEGVCPIEAINREFDPNLHEAVFHEEAEGKEANTVIKEMQKGYTMHGRVLRPSMVVIAK